MLRLGVSLLLVMGLTTSGAIAKAENETAGWEEAEEAEKPAPEAETATAAQESRSAGANGKSNAASKSASKATSKSKKKSRSKRRRGAKVAGHVVPDEKLRPEPAPKPSGNLHLYSVATQEEAKVNIYNEDGSYNIEALKAASHILRCKRTDTEKEIEPRLFVALSHVYDHFGEKRIEIVSGFRNQRRTSSFHYRGSAADIRVPGATPKVVRAYVESLDAGGMGIGLYPNSKFVHVDVRPPPSYRWIDYSKADPNSPDKRPPRNVKKKRLQS